MTISKEDLQERYRKLSNSKKALLEKRLHQQVLKLPAIPRRQTDVSVPTSFAQQRLWFLDQLDPGSVAYTIPLVLRLQGMLDLPVLQASLHALIHRHEVLRTTFGTHDGQPIQQIADDPPLDCTLHDLSLLPPAERRNQERTLLTQEIATPFNLEKGPLFRARLLRCGEQEHILLLLFHHIIFDGWSLGVLMRELVAFYAAALTGEPATLPPLPVQYADYAAWQRSWLQGERLQEQLTYWQRQLRGAPAFLDLPTDFVRPPQQTFRGRSLTFHCPPALRTELEQLSRQENTTLFMTLLAAWQVLLSRYSGQQDLVVGSPIANRTRPEIEGLLGFFVNTLALRTDLSGQPSFREVLRRVREVALGAYSHQELPFEQVVEAVQPPRDASRSPLFQVMFALEMPAPATVELPGLRIEVVQVEDQVAKLDLSLGMQVGDEGLHGVLEYNCDLFTEERMQHLIEHWMILLQDIVARPTCPIGYLALLSTREQQQLVADWNATQSAYPQDQCLHQLFEKQAERTPDAIAVIFEERQLTYQELHHQANRLAHYLQRLGVGPEVRVGLCVERSLEMIVGLLGILKAGGAYIPLDPTYPQERLAFMVEDAQIALTVTQSRFLETMSQQVSQLICLDTDWNKILGESSQNVCSDVNASNLAYVIYTSGSTGKPKGVMVNHRGVCNLAVAQQQTFGVGAGDRVLQFASLSFDASVSEIIMALSSGAALLLATRMSLLPGQPLIDLLQQQRITVATLPPTVLINLPDVELPVLQKLIVAGEACPASVVERWAPGRNFFNAYGPTETTVCATIAAGIAPGSTPSIGRPLANTQVYILDAHQQLVPVGVSGELYIGGVGVARGYMNRPDLTAERFISNPFDEAGSWLYRTGDLAKYRADGNLVYLGRQDSQVKVRGYRIELGEIEAVLQRQPGVREAVVIVQEDGSGYQQLIAYLVPNENYSQPGELRAALQRSLPDYMVPAQFVLLKVFPLTLNGKIDRKALPAPDRGTIEAGESYVAPRDQIEAQLISIWEEVLQRSQIGITDNFFEVGGHSLLAVVLISRVKQVFQRDLPLVTLFRHATIQAFAELLREPEPQLADSASSLVPIQPQGRKTPLFFIHPIGGEVLCYGELASQLGADQPFYGLRFPFGEEAIHMSLCMENLAAHYIDALRAVQPQGPYQLGGWSLGGTIAYAIAQQLRAQREEIAALVLIDSYVPTPSRDESDDILLLLEMVVDLAQSIGNALPDRVNQPGFREDIYRELTKLSLEERLRFIWEQGQTMQLIPTTFTLSQMQRIFTVFKANSTIVRDYTPALTDQRIILFTSDERTDTTHDRGNGWSKLNQGPLEIYPLPGTHYTLLKKPCVAMIAEQLKRLL